jgi:uridine phosphorylase
MPYRDADPAAFRELFGLAQPDCPTGALIVGQWGQDPYLEMVHSIWPAARQVEEHSLLITLGGARIWVSVVFGAAMAATMAHLVIKLGARSLISAGSFGGLVADWQAGDILVPSSVTGRDGVSSRTGSKRPLIPDQGLSETLRDELTRSGGAALIHSGALVSTTTFALERPADITRWARTGFTGVEMECAAVMALAARFAIPAAGAFVLMDNLAAGRTFFASDVQDERQIKVGKEVILRAGVATLISTAKH